MATSADLFAVSAKATSRMSTSHLSEDVMVRLRELEQELLDGDITEKGYVKKKQRILEAARGPTLLYVDLNCSNNNGSPVSVDYESEELTTSSDEDGGEENEDDLKLKSDNDDKNNSKTTNAPPHSTATITLACSKLKKRNLMLAAGPELLNNVNTTNGTVVKTNLSEDADLDEICQHYLEQNGGANGGLMTSTLQESIIKANNFSTNNNNINGAASLEDSHFQSELRTEAVIEALHNFSESNHNFRANLPVACQAQGRGSRIRASSISLSQRQKQEEHLLSQEQIKHRRKSSSSATREAEPSPSKQVKASSEGPSEQRIVDSQKIADMAPNHANGPLMKKRTESSSSSTAPSPSSSMPMSQSTTSSAGQTRLVLDANGILSEQVPDIILDLRDLENSQQNSSGHQEGNFDSQTNNSLGSRASSGGCTSNVGAPTDLQQLIMSNFNYGTAARDGKKNKKKNKNKGFRAQQVMYLAGRGTHASELTRTTSGAIFSNEQGPPQSQAKPSVAPENPQFRGRVSTKIEQLARTLRRPKPKPLQEYFQDDSEILFQDAAAKSAGRSQNPNAPEPVMSPIVAEPLKSTAGLPMNPLFALFRYGSSSTYRSQAISIVDPRNGKISQTVYYHKLLENSMRLAQALSSPKKFSQLIPASEQNVNSKVLETPKAGSRVVLAYAMGDAISFATAFYACLLAGLVPVPIDPPTNTRREMFCQSIGIFVGAVGAQYVLTSYDSFRQLAKDSHTGAVCPIKCWPNVSWLLFDQAIATNLAKPSKNWKPYVAPDSSGLEQQLAFIQYSVTRDGDVLPIALSYDCVTKHLQSLASALGVVEGQLVVNLLDVKRDFGIWFSLLASVYYGMHVVLVSFAQVKADPLLWLRVVSRHKPSVVLARSRDLYWTVMSHRADMKEYTNVKSLPDHLRFDLSSVKQLIVADAANSWTVSPCESFINQFGSFGFKADAITPVAFSPECLTVSVRRPGHVIGDARLSLDQLSSNQVQIDTTTLRCLAIQDCGTVLPASTLAVVKLINQGGEIQGSCVDLCKPDEIGEICVARHQQWSPTYFDLSGQSSVTFKLTLNQPKPQQPACNPNPEIHPGATLAQNSTSNVYFSRSGLFGFVSPAGSVFVVGSRELSIFTNGRRYSADDLSATILAVQPQNFVYRARLCIVPVRLARDERIVAVVEQNVTEHPTDSAAFGWMAKVIQAIDSLHNVSLYSLAVVMPGRLPRTPQGFINRHAVRRLFEDGHLHPTNILLCPHSAITNLPQPRLTPAAVHPSAQLLSNLLHGQKLAVAQGPHILSQQSTSSLMAKSESFDSQSAMVYNNGHNTVSSCNSHLQGSLHHTTNTHQSGTTSRLSMTPTPGSIPGCTDSSIFANQACISERLKILAQRDPERILYSYINQKGLVECELSAMALHRRAERVACQLLEKARVQPGDRVVILLPAPSSDFLAAIYGAFYVGCVPMVVRSPMAENLQSALSSCVLTVQICKPTALLCTPQLARFFRSKEASKMLVPPKQANNSKLRKMPKVIAIDGTKSNSSSKRLANIFRPQSLDATLYIDLIVSSSGSLTGVRVSHASTLALCRSLKMQAELYPSRDILLAGLDPLSGLGFVLFALESIYAGHKTLVTPLCEIEADPFCWLRAAATLQVRDVYCSPATLELCVRGFFQNPSTGLSQLKEEDLKISLTNVRSCTVISEERPQTALLSQFVKAFQSFGLQRRCVTAAFGCRMNIAVCLQPSNAPEPEIVHIDTKSLRNDRLSIVERGSPYAVCLTACGKVLPGTKCVIANPETRAQLGEDHLGEIWVSASHNTSGFYTVGGVTEGDAEAAAKLEPFDARFSARLETGDTSTIYARTGFLGFIRNSSLFVVGSIEQSIFINNQRYQPCDLEATLQKLDPRRIPECAVFLASNLLVAVIEFEGPEAWALDLIPAATRCLLEAHQLIAGVVVIVEPGVVPLNSRGEKQRALLRDAFLADQLDPIYVSYNL